jgi:hypothetical protein
MEKLLWLFNIDDDRRMRARELWALLLPHAGSIISNFYKLIQSINIHPPLSDFAINRLRKKPAPHQHPAPRRRAERKLVRRPLYDAETRI